jgi:hypothetical protein
LNPALGSCYAVQTPVNFDAATLPHGEALNAGAQITTSGPMFLNAPSTTPGNYSVTVTPADLPVGNYTVTSVGGPDVGSFRGNFSVPAPLQWTNNADFNVSALRTGQPMTFKWTAGDPSGYVKVEVLSQNTSVKMAIQCNAPASAGSLTVPDYLTRVLPQGGGTLSVSSFGMPSTLSAPGLDVFRVQAGSTTSMQVNFLTPPSN